ncbi:MAG TPA: NYN domain-containing protein [Clostridia bacterium]|nr:NYN domain-containing protein [Clostridia bacterium]
MTPLLIVDGYNVIGQWKRVAQKGWTMDEARDMLAHRLTEYAAFEGLEVVLVFDAMLSERLQRTEEARGAVTVVFTRQGESADQYIERLVDQIPRRREVRVATSDAVEQTVVLGRGAVRIPARELLRDMAESQRQQQARINTAPIKAYPIYQRLPPDQQAALEKLRREK